MSFNYLPLPVYIILILFLFQAMIFLAITRRNKDRIGLVGVYITVSAAVPFVILGKIIPKYYDITSRAVIVIIGLVFVEFTVMAVNDFRKGKLNQVTLVGLILGWMIMIFFALIFLNII